jgi:hypothetical protein
MPLPERARTGSRAQLLSAERCYLVVMPVPEARWLVGEHGPLSGYLPVPRDHILARIAPGSVGLVVFNETAVGCLLHTHGDGRVDYREGELFVLYGRNHYRLRDLGPHASQQPG